MINKFKHLILILFVFSMFCLTSCTQKPLTIKAALVYNNGVQPVARTKFYLLNKDLQSFGIKEQIYTSPLFAPFKGGVGINEELVKDSIVATSITDFEGNAKFENVPSGVYYVTGIATTRSKFGFAVWSVKVDVNSSANVIMLDQNNAFDTEN